VLPGFHDERRDIGALERIAFEREPGPDERRDPLLEGSLPSIAGAFYPPELVELETSRPRTYVVPPRFAGEPRFAAYFDGWTTDWTFAGPEETERRLHGAGFTDVWCWLSRVDVDPGDPAGYLGAICLGSFLARLPEDLHEPFVAAALERLPDPLRLRYVRLNMLARA